MRWPGLVRKSIGVSSRPQYDRLGSLAEVSRNQRYVATAKPLKKPLSAYLRENFHCATSGMGWEPPIMHVHAVMGADRLLYAMDYPYQFVPEAVVVQDNLPLDAGDKRKFFKPAPSGYSCSDQQTAGVRPIGPCSSKHS